MSQENIYLCKNCKTFTLEQICPKCNEKTTKPKPNKYSAHDKNGEYRKKLKYILLKEKNN